MFCGGCSSSASGGVKVFRVVLALKCLFRGASRYARPNVVRALRLAGDVVDTQKACNAILYIVTFATLIVVTSIVVISIEPDAVWLARGSSSVEKMVDLGSGTLCMYSNTGLALGALGSQGNFGCLTPITKLLFSWAMILGRLEVWAVLALLSPRFWRRV